MKLVMVGSLVLSCVFLEAAAWAQQFPTSDPSFSKQDPSLASTGPEGFGSPGQMVITGDFRLDLGYVSKTLNNLSVSGPDITIAPSLLFFLARNLAVGGLINFHHEAEGDSSTTEFALGPLAGYNIWISPRASIFPLVGIEYIRGKLSQQTSGGRETITLQRFALLLKAPVLFHPFPHLFVGFGPILLLDFTSKLNDADYAKTRSFGLTLDLGFYL